MSFYAKHVFFCCNQRDGGDRPSCNAKGASQMRDYAKGRIKKLGLAGEGKVRILTRVLGIVLAALAVQFVLNGLAGFYGSLP